MTNALLLVLLLTMCGRSSASRDDLLKDGYFGAGEPKPDDETVKPFNITVPESVLQDLRHRLQNARIGHVQLEDQPNYEYGFSVKSLTQLRDFWLNEYDWRQAESEIAQFPHFETEIEGLRVHFIRAAPPAGVYRTVRPLLAVHGWPGSVQEWTRALGPLSDPRAHGLRADHAFLVVCPSIPGFGWSAAPRRSGLHPAAVARIFHKLMQRLGFDHYYTQGGDLGATITGDMARLYPNNVRAAHLNMLVSGSKSFLLKGVAGSVLPSLFFKHPAFKDFSLKRYLQFFVANGGYFHLQATTPDTAGIPLNDSPIGLMAWMLEKFALGTNSNNVHFEDGHLTEKFSKADLITAVMVYWVNGNAVSSARFYKELIGNKDSSALQNEYIKVPTGYAACLKDAVPAIPEELARSAVNLHHYSTLDVGHFAVMEDPRLLVQDMFRFFDQFPQQSPAL